VADGADRSLAYPMGEAVAEENRRFVRPWLET
jgi:hypothetical protein